MLEEISENYFYTLNSLSSRIGGDIRSIRAAYEDLWCTYSLSEQEQIINESIIQPKVLLKYSLGLQDLYGKGACSFPIGQKIVIDEHTGCFWKDEHSAPFSWKTKSQLELCHNEKCVPGSLAGGNVSAQKPTFVGTPIDAKDEVDTTISEATASANPISNFYSRLKVFPGKTKCVQDTQQRTDFSLLTKLKNNAIYKVQSTLRMVSGKIGGARNSEGDVLVLGGGAVIVPRTQKPSPKVAKPSCPPPPPPPRVLLHGDQAETPLLSPNTPILDERDDHDNSNHSLFQNLPDDPLDSSDVEEEGGSKSSLVGTIDSNMPKSGFDFLDNW